MDIGELMGISHLIYTSKATGPVNDAVLASIQEAALEHNPKLGITGMLLYGGGYFIHLLEGERDNVTALYGRLTSDGLHADLKIVFRGPAEERLFPNWAMAVANMTNVNIHVELRKLWDSLDVPNSTKKCEPQQYIEAFKAIRARAAEMPRPE